MRLQWLPVAMTALFIGITFWLYLVFDAQSHTLDRLIDSMNQCKDTPNGDAIRHKLDEILDMVYFQRIFGRTLCIASAASAFISLIASIIVARRINAAPSHNQSLE